MSSRAVWHAGFIACMLPAISAAQDAPEISLFDGAAAPAPGALTVTGFGEPIGLTCSIGVAASDVLGVGGEPLIAQADAAVYIAKRSGRNRVQMAVPLGGVQVGTATSR